MSQASRERNHAILLRTVLLLFRSDQHSFFPHQLPLADEPYSNNVNPSLSITIRYDTCDSESSNAVADNEHVVCDILLQDYCTHDISL